MSPGASSFPCGLSGGDSGRGSQRGDGGRGPGRRRLLPLPLSLGARTASVAFPARSPTAPGRSGLLGLEVGGRHAASGTPTFSRGGGCCGLPLPPSRAQDPGDKDGGRPGSHCPDPGEGDGVQDLPLRNAILSSRDPRILGGEEGRRGVGGA